jgi:DNA repair exonuclease SbcCD ATPase subunit
MKGPWLWAAAFVAHVAAGRVRVSPVEKVVAMLQDNKNKIEADLEAEEKEMAEYSQFCDHETSEKTYAIKTANRKIDDLIATISDCKAQLKGVEDEVAEIGTQMAAKEKELADASAVRKEDKSEFTATEKELVAAVDQLEKAVVLLKKGLSLTQVWHKNPNIQMVLQSLSRIVDAAWLDDESRASLRGLLQQQDELKANMGESMGEADDLRLPKKEKTGTEAIIESIQDMKSKAEETLSNTRNNEMKSQHNFQMMTMSLDGAMTLLKEKLSEQQALKASLSEESGKAKGELGETRESMKADKVYLSSLTHDCESSAEEWTEREKSAKSEIAAIDKAKEILSPIKAMLQNGVEVDGRKKQPFEEDHDEDKDTKMRSTLVGKLRELGHKFHSYTMMELVSAAASDPFEKIRGLLGDMIAKLVAEANEEASQKAFCDEEMAKSNKEKENKNMRLDKLQAKLDHATATTAELEDAIKELQAELADIDKATAEATKLRNEEHATYEKASKDYKAGAQAVEDAIGVLKEFYAGAFTQVSKVDANGKQPKFGGPKSDAGGGIIAILEISAEEFTKMYTEVQSDELTAKATYDRMMQESKVSTATKQTEVKAMESELKQLAVAIQSSTQDKIMVSKELDAVMAYLDKLKPQCETKVMSYEEKVARRKAEIEGLKEALEILVAPSLVQRRSLRHVSSHV